MTHILAQQIPFIHDCKELIPISKGFSSDEKYRVEMTNNETYTLRLFKRSELQDKKNEFTILDKMQEYNVSCSRPIFIGELEDRGYMLTSYLEGIDGEEAIQNLTELDQYTVGIEAGIELKKMHHYSAPKSVSSWYSRKVKKHEKYIDEYLQCGVRIKQDEKIMQWINDHIVLMKGRPNLFQHDDFTLGNIIVKNKKFAGVIDFGRYDWGDPFHEFLKVGIFTREKSIPFSIGQIRGYFNGDPDDDFWKLYSLYLAMCVFSTVVWTLKVIPENLEEMLDKINMFLDDHDYFDCMKPKWYK